MFHEQKQVLFYLYPIFNARKCVKRGSCNLFCSKGFILNIRWASGPFGIQNPVRASSPFFVPCSLLFYLGFDPFVLFVSVLACLLIFVPYRLFCFHFIFVYFMFFYYYGHFVWAQVRRGPTDLRP